MLREKCWYWRSHRTSRSGISGERVLRGLIARVARRPDVRQASVTTLGTFAAQIVLLATTPVLSRIYTPEAFGHLAVLLSVATIGGSVASLCYHFVIFLPKRSRVAAAVYRLNIYLSFVGSAICTAIFAAFIFFSSQQHTVASPLDLLLVYLAVLLTAHFGTLGNVESRLDQYWSIALSKLNNSLAPALAQIALGFAGLLDHGLMIGRVLGQFVAVGLMHRDMPAGFRVRDLLRPRWRELRLVACRYRDAPLHVPRVIAVRAASSLPATLFLMFYGATLAGLYFMAERLVERPGALLSDTLLRLPIKLFAERVRKRQPLARAALLYTFACAGLVLPPVLLLVTLGPWIIRVLLGPAWAGTEQFVVILAVAAGLRMASLPMTALVPVLRIHTWSMFIDFAFFFRIFLIPLAAVKGFSAVIALSALASVSVCYYVLIGVISHSAARRYDRSLSSSSGRGFV